MLTDVIKIEKGDISFGAINPKTNTMYLGYKNLNMILVVDINAKKILTKIQIFKPKFIQINPETNMVYVIANGTVSIIDGATNKLVKEIQDDAPFARFLAINPEKNLLYVTYNNGSDKSRKKDPIDKLVVFDGLTHSKINEISLGLKEPEGLAIDNQSNHIYVANSKTSTVSVLDGTSNSIIDYIEFPGDKFGWLGGGYQRLDNIVMLNNRTNLLYVVGTIGSSGDGGGAELFCLFVVNVSDKQLIHKQNLDGSASEICASVGINPQNDLVYIRKPSKNAILIMDGYAKTTIDSVELTKTGFFKKMFSDKADPIIVNQATNKVYQADGKSGLLLEIDGSL
jgi:DNA-binding beta-propeller fold protein YncE